MKVPDWVDEERLEERVHQLAEEIIASAEQSADEARKFFGVRETTDEIDLPEHLEARILKARRKRFW